MPKFIKLNDTIQRKHPDRWKDGQKDGPMEGQTDPILHDPCSYCQGSNEIVNKFLLAVDKFMPEMHLKQPGFTYSACGPFTKNKERI